ncbi:polysaccharide deacetylase family protein [Flavobacterium limnophilum]|uniref:polysaccharide deacetylase family protein n=1 Tax=Flavobacterium limnophilum TaxID=3003262 RepID=UPI0024828723|nr:polysaccharide deacetylase family protein [Flavobacterium limnophilum]
MKHILPSFLAGLILSMAILFKSETIKREVPEKRMVHSAKIVLKPEIPVLCYHRIRNILGSDGKNMKIYSVSPVHFAQQMKALHDNGYHTVLPDQLYQYLVNDGNLPPKPIIITFDDTREEHYRIGAPEMNKYGYKGVFFIMTVSINRPGYMTKAQIKDLSDSGNGIGAHTWDHHPVTKYKEADWNIQIINPKKQLESITGKPINYFAYPCGEWNSQAIAKLKNNGYQLGFILSTKSNPDEPLFTIRRLIVPGSLSADGMLKAVESSFKK